MMTPEPFKKSGDGLHVLATGGAGYIGSHVVVELIAAGYEVTILDNFENSTPDVIDRIGGLCGQTPRLVRADCRDTAALDGLFEEKPVDVVIHLAGKKAVGESVEDPLAYYDANVGGAIALLDSMRRHEVRHLVFSSSASVYGAAERLPIIEGDPTRPSNPYGRTKLIIEQIVSDTAASDPHFSAVSLRYFNPVAAHPTGMLGERPATIPSNLFPYVAQTAAGLRDVVQVFGQDYETPDGTGVRDYIHVVDLAKGHVRAVEKLVRGGFSERHLRFNLGTGRGYSVLEVLTAFSDACGAPIAHRILPRRPGDVACSVADPSRAMTELHWQAEHDLDTMCRDHWAFQTALAAGNSA